MTKDLQKKTKNMIKFRNICTSNKETILIQYKNCDRSFNRANKSIYF